MMLSTIDTVPALAAGTVPRPPAPPIALPAVPAEEPAADALGDAPADAAADRGTAVTREQPALLTGASAAPGPTHPPTEENEAVGPHSPSAPVTLEPTSASTPEPSPETVETSAESVETAAASPTRETPAATSDTAETPDASADPADAEGDTADTAAATGSTAGAPASTEAGSADGRRSACECTRRRTGQRVSSAGLADGADGCVRPGPGRARNQVREQRRG